MNWSFGIAMLETGATGGGVGSLLLTMLPLIGIFALLYFIMIRPQKKKEKQAAEMRNALEVGDSVTTIGGIVGYVVSIKDDTFVIETGGERTRMRFKRWALQDVDKLNLDAPGTSAPAKTEPEKGKGEK